MSTPLALGLLLLAGSSSISVSATASNNSSACYQVSQIYKNANPTGTGDLLGGPGSVSVPAEVALECLQSMPFDTDKGAQFITEIQKYIQWQTTVEILKNPPPGYLSPAVDIVGDLDEIQANASAGFYTNQFEFDQAVQAVFTVAHDEHFSIDLCSQSIFAFQIEFPLVSVSSDGLEVPKVYTWGDLQLLSTKSSLVTPVVSINGEDVVQFLENFAVGSWCQDPDARYNTIFRSRYQALTEINGEENLGLWEYNRGFWPGSHKFQIGFANGSMTTVHTTATIEASLTGFPYENGISLFESVCIPSTTEESTVTTTATSTKSKRFSTASASVLSPIASGYPTPIVKLEDNSLSGYFLDQPEDMKNVAVLFLASFTTTALPDEYPALVLQFIQHAKSAGKERLIIDLSNNDGGNINFPPDIFKILFPNTEIPSYTRFRSHEAIDLIGQALSQVPTTDVAIMDYNPVFMLSTLTTPDQKSNFANWSDIHGPHLQLGTNVSSLMSVENFTLENIYGYGSSTLNETEPPFAVEDILLVTNGYCGSACTVFAEFLKNIMGVKSLAFGGRPQTGPMQVLGATKGQLASGERIVTSYTVALEVANNATKDSNPVLTDGQIKRLEEITPVNVLTGVESVGVNLLNGYRSEDDEMPLQFIYEPADCRLFYTVENILRPATAWVSAARVFWGNGSCVAGSVINGTVQEV